jgi:F420 biosynthesis protein FbiB-like protein
LTPIDLHAFLRSRRSIRRFKPQPVPSAVLNEILLTASHAPSAHNRQPWRFAVSTDSATKSGLAGAMAAEFRRDLERSPLPRAEIEERIRRSVDRIVSAPVAVVLCVDMSEMDEYPDERRSHAEFVMATQSAANAGLQLLLAAHAEGLGGVWVCSPLFAQEAVLSFLNLPASWKPQAMFLIGYPLGTPAPRPRKSLDEVSRIIP